MLHRDGGTLLLYGAIGTAQRVAGTTAIMLWSACGAMLMAGAANSDHDLPRARAALARPLRAVRRGRSQDRARVGAQVFDPQLDGTGFLLFGIGAAVRRDRQRACSPIS